MKDDGLSDRWATTYMDLLIWKKAIDFVTAIYDLTATFPKSEMLGLTSQLRRAAVSIPSNMAEGYGRRSNAELVRFCQIAMGSLFEVQTQLILSRNLGFIVEPDFLSTFEGSKEIERMTCSFIETLKSK